MGKRYALNFGVSHVAPSHYADQEMLAVEERVYGLSFVSETTNYYSELFDKLGFNDSESVLDEVATSSVVKNKVTQYSEDLEEGDLLVISFCGHTLAVNEEYDLVNAQNEDKGWMMYDRVLFHFEIWSLIQKFKEGVKVVLFVDTCYTGDADFAALVLISRNIKSSYESFQRKELKVPKCFVNNKFIYDIILENSSSIPKYKIPPAVIIISSTNETSKAMPVPGREERTKFSVAVEDTYTQKEKAYSWSSFFDEISWQTVHNKLYTVLNEEHDRDPNMVFEAFKNHKGRSGIMPQWHYYQGYKYTTLKIESIKTKKSNN